MVATAGHILLLYYYEHTGQLEWPSDDFNSFRNLYFSYMLNQCIFSVLFDFYGTECVSKFSSYEFWCNIWLKFLLFMCSSISVKIR